MTPIYLDYAASAPLLPEAWDAMRPWAMRAGNAASSHAFGRAARKALDDARQRIAGRLDCDADEILFTSGATEANNLALFGLAHQPGAILASAIEHPCVGEPIQKLVARGYRLVPLPVETTGIVGPIPAIPDDLRLAALMLANHETGAIQPVRALRDTLPANVPLHCDAAAAVGKIPVSFRQLGVTTLTLSAHKFHGPQGIGVLVVKKGTRTVSQMFGGHQQQGKRPGTEPVALIVGMAAAIDWAVENLDRHLDQVRQLRESFLQLLDDSGPQDEVQTAQADRLAVGGRRPGRRLGGEAIIVNGGEDGVPHVINVSFPGLSADALLMALDLAGVACSTGSACSSGSLLPSPVLKAMRVPDEVLRSAMRFSVSPQTTAAEVAKASNRISLCVKRLRRLASDPEA